MKPMSPDDKEKMVCSQAAIRTPEMLATGLFLTYLNPKKQIETIEIYPPEKEIGTFSRVFEKTMFQFPGSPKQFFNEELPNKLKGQGKFKSRFTQAVKKRDDLVELSLWYSEVKTRPVKVWLFDLSKSGCCVYYYNLTVAVESDFVNANGHWIPKRSTIWDDQEYRETKFFDVEVNPKFPDDEFSYLTFPCLDTGWVYDKISGTTEKFGDRKKSESQKLPTKK